MVNIQMSSSEECINIEASDKNVHFKCELVDEEELRSCCYGYQCNIAKTIFYYALCLITFGFMFLISYWKPAWKLCLTHSRCILKKAGKVLIVDQFNTVFVENVKHTSTTISKLGKMMEYQYFWHKHQKYYFDSKEGVFKHLGGLDCTESFYELTHCYHGIENAERRKYLLWYGENDMDIEVKSYARLFFEEGADPFYIFQVFSIILWFMEEYYYYAIAIAIVSLVSIIISIIQTRKHLVTLRNMIAKSDCVDVMKPNGEYEQIKSSDVVPGDLIVVPKNGGTMHCDAVLISGTVIVNESMLTGESLPVTKTALSRPTHKSDIYNDVYDTLKHKRHTLFSGTKILQTRYYGNEKVIAVVVKTGFSTMKGNLVRSILFPKPMDFKFFKDAIKFVGILGVFALIGLCYSIYILVHAGASIGDIVKKSLDVITIAVPPSLPAAMSVGTVYALQRLKKANIFCISPSRVNISGKIKLFCFDKTGTLTEDGLDFCGFIKSEEFSFHDITKPFDASPNDHSTIGMAACHSLTIIDGDISGDPLDVKMFGATGWEMEEVGPDETERYGNIIPMIVKPKGSAADAIRIKYLNEMDMPLEVAILKQFTFSSELQRMSVIVRRLGKRNMEVYVKGSPEMVASLCNPHTLPTNYDECLMSYTKLGYRVLALAYKTLDSKVSWHKVQQFQRSQAECDLNFLGFIIMKNVLKPETPPIIQQLYKAKIRVVMVTGDNILTAACVARECGMVLPADKIINITLDNAEGLQFSLLGEMEGNMNIDSSYMADFENPSFLKRSYHFAVTGKVYNVIQSKYPMLYVKLLVCGTIFSRMLPDQKTSLIEGLQSLGYGVGMCGDGANDCGALKRAHTGISLSDSEASIASPFTSKIPNISCVINVIKEGRCALVTSFNIFKYMALYSMIQYSSVLILYSISSNLGDFQYLYIDLFTITPFAVTMSRTGPANAFVAKRPLGRLMHPFVLFSVVLQIVIQMVFQIAVFYYVRMLPNYKPIEDFRSKSWYPGESQIVCYENTMLFNFTSFQYIIVALVFSVGRPYRQPFYRNILFLISGIVLSTITCLFTIQPNKYFMKYLELLSIDDKYYYIVFFGLLFFNLLLSYMVDHVFLDISCIQKCLKWMLRKKGPRNRYKVILNEIDNDPSWPPSTSYEHKVIC